MEEINWNRAMLISAVGSIAISLLAVSIAI